MNKIISCIVVCMIGIAFGSSDTEPNMSDVVHIKKCADCKKKISVIHKFCNECIVKHVHFHR